MQAVQISDNDLFFNAFGLQMQQNIRSAAIRQTDQRSYRVQAFPVNRCFSTGVCPRGAQVLRRGGLREKPVSSRKTSLAPRFTAPFLSEASP
jgi:hypothetical protein